MSHKITQGWQAIAALKSHYETQFGPLLTDDCLKLDSVLLAAETRTKFIVVMLENHLMNPVNCKDFNVCILQKASLAPMYQIELASGLVEAIKYFNKLVFEEENPNEQPAEKKERVKGDTKKPCGCPYCFWPDLVTYKPFDREPVVNRTGFRPAIRIEEPPANTKCTRCKNTFYTERFILAK